MSRADKYILPSGVAFLGSALIIAPLFLKAPSDYATYTARETLEQSETINRARIKQRKQTADVIRQTGVLPEGRILTIVGYVDNEKRPPGLKPKTLNRYFPDQIVHVFDESGVCVGLIQNREFVWNRQNASACKNAPVVTSDE
jgi:hypothetical protein